MSNSLSLRWWPRPDTSPGRWLMVILLFVLLLRGLNLGYKSMWLDETFSVWVAEKAESASLVPLDPAHPPLYYTFLHYWIAQFGDAAAIVRLPSLLISLVNILLLFLVARFLLGVEVAFIAAALLAVSPLDAWYAQEARMYAWLACCILLIGLGFVWQHPAGAILLLMGLTLGLYSGYFIFPLTLWLTTPWLIFWWRQGRNVSLLLLNGGAMIMAWWLYRPWWPYFQEWLLGYLGNHWLVRRLAQVVGIGHFAPIHFAIALVLGVVGLLGGGLIGLEVLKRPYFRRWIIPAGILLFALLTLTMPIPRLYGLKRIISIGWPLLILSVAWLVGQLKASRDNILGGLLALSLLATLVNLFLIPKDDWQRTVSYLNQHIVSGETVWLDPSWNFNPYNYYRPVQPAQYGPVNDLAQLHPNSVWLIAERYPGQPISASEAWLEANLQFIERIPFYRLELRHYK